MALSLFPEPSVELPLLNSSNTSNFNRTWLQPPRPKPYQDQLPDFKLLELPRRTAYLEARFFRRASLLPAWPPLSSPRAPSNMMHRSSARGCLNPALLFQTLGTSHEQKS